MLKNIQRLAPTPPTGLYSYVAPLKHGCRAIQVYVYYITAFVIICFDFERLYRYLQYKLLDTCIPFLFQVGQDRAARACSWSDGRNTMHIPEFTTVPRGTLFYTLSVFHFSLLLLAKGMYALSTSFTHHYNLMDVDI